MWETLFAIAAVLFVVALIAGIALFVSRKVIAAERDQLQRQLDDKIAELQSVKRERADLVTQLRDAFKSVGVDVLKQFKDDFQKDASTQLDQRKAAIETMLKPIREALEKHAKAVTEVEKERKQDQGSLRQELASMLEVQRRLGDQTTALTTALKGSATARGRWGEITLRRVVEIAGMSAYCDFDEQVTIWTGDDRLRPDMVVNMPSNRSIVIDAKAVGENYLQAMETDDPERRKQLLVKHTADLKSRVAELSRKSYSQSLTHAPDFVLLFVPGEAFLAAALDTESNLADSAMASGVVIVTPAILYSLLRVVEMGWRETRLAENAERIRDFGVELHERIATVLEKIADHGKHLDTAVSSFNSLAGSTNTRLVPAIKKFAELGAKSGKDVTEIKPIETRPREVRQAGQPVD